MTPHWQRSSQLVNRTKFEHQWNNTKLRFELLGSKQLGSTRIYRLPTCFSICTCSLHMSTCSSHISSSASNMQILDEQLHRKTPSCALFSSRTRLILLANCTYLCICARMLPLSRLATPQKETLLRTVFVKNLHLFLLANCNISTNFHKKKPSYAPFSVKHQFDQFCLDRNCICMIT